MVRRPRRLAVRAMRQAISPRLAIKTERNMAAGLERPRAAPPAATGRRVGGSYRTYCGDPPETKFAAGAGAIAAACAGGAGGAGVHTGSGCSTTIAGAVAAARAGAFARGVAGRFPRFF